MDGTFILRRRKKEGEKVSKMGLGENWSLSLSSSLSLSFFLSFSFFSLFWTDRTNTRNLVNSIPFLSLVFAYFFPPSLSLLFLSSFFLHPETSGKILLLMQPKYFIPITDSLSNKEDKKWEKKIPSSVERKRKQEIKR